MAKKNALIKLAYIDAKCERDSLETNKEIARQSRILQMLV